MAFHSLIQKPIIETRTWHNSGFWQLWDSNEKMQSFFFCLLIIFSIMQSSRTLVILTAAPSSVSKSFWFPGNRTKICSRCPEGSSIFYCLIYSLDYEKKGMPHVGALHVPNGSLPRRAPLPSMGFFLAFSHCWLCSFPVKTSSAEV